MRSLIGGLGCVTSINYFYDLVKSRTGLDDSILVFCREKEQIYCNNRTICRKLKSVIEILVSRTINVLSPGIGDEASVGSGQMVGMT